MSSGPSEKGGRGLGERNAITPDTEACPPCDRWGRALADHAAFRLGTERRCLHCTSRYGPMLRRSLWAALAVDQVPKALLWQVPLTDTVPLCVATWGSLGSAPR